MKLELSYYVKALKPSIDGGKGLIQAPPKTIGSVKLK